MIQPVYVVDYVRTPIGRFGGALAAVRPDDRPFPHHDRVLHSTSIGWRMINPAMPEEYVVSNGESTWWSSTRRSPPRCWPVWTSGRRFRRRR